MEKLTDLPMDLNSLLDLAGDQPCLKLHMWHFNNLLDLLDELNLSLQAVDPYRNRREAIRRLLF